jgi:hypothetical protein
MSKNKLSKCFTLKIIFEIADFFYFHLLSSTEKIIQTAKHRDFLIVALQRPTKTDLTSQNNSFCPSTSGNFLTFVKNLKLF